MKKLTFKKMILALSLIAALGGGLSYYFLFYERGPIYEYNEKRDTDNILKLFRENVYWLTSSSDYSPEFMLKHRAPNRNPLYIGKLHIKTLYDHGNFIGFVAYYMKSAQLGFILFLAIKSELRGKRYGEQLMRYALKDLEQMGAQTIRLVTRPSNLSAQALYKRVGFYETSRDEDFVYFEYMPVVS